MILVDIMAVGITTAHSAHITALLPEGRCWMRDSKVIESWMFHQDTVAILDFLKEAQKQIP